MNISLVDVTGFVGLILMLVCAGLMWGILAAGFIGGAVLFAIAWQAS